MIRAAGVTLFVVIAALACGDEGTRPGDALTDADSADQILYGVVDNVTRNGIRHSRLEADTAYLYEARQMSVMKRVRAAFFDESGAESSTLTANRVEYNWRDNSMRAEGDVVLNAPGGRRLTTSALVYDPGQNSLSSDQPFVLMRGSERIEGDGFRADADFENFVASRPRGVAGDSLVLPGQ